MIISLDLLAIEAILPKKQLFWQINEGFKASFLFKSYWQEIDQWRADKLLYLIVSRKDVQ